MKDEELEIDIGHTLAPLYALNEKGERVRFGTLWEDQPAALFFIRHFG